MHTIPNHSVNLYLLGDYHKQEAQLIEFLESIEKGSSVIQLGDLEAHHPADLIHLDELLWQHKVTMYCLRGNHDNPKFWTDREKWTGLLELRNLVLLDEVDCVMWSGIKFITVNGAVSVDRTCIRFDRGECYPSEEQIPSDVIQRIKEIGPGEILLTHTGNPNTHTGKNDFVDSYASTDEHLLNDIQKERTLVQKIQIASGCKKHFYGHFHQSHQEEQYGVETQCLNICESHEIEYKIPIDHYKILRSIADSLPEDHEERFMEKGAWAIFRKRLTVDEVKSILEKIRDDTSKEPSNVLTAEDFFTPEFIEKMKDEDPDEISQEEFYEGLRKPSQEGE